MSKKSNMFMIAYVVFLLISAWIPNQNHLNKVALGATYAGWLFAWADTFISNNTYFTKNIKDRLCLMAEVKHKTKSLLNDKNLNKKEIEDINNSLKIYDDIEQSSLKSIKMAQRLNMLGYIVFGCGIFVFLSIITFYSEQLHILGYLIWIEKRMTIGAFAMVVLNYCISDIWSESNEKQIDKLEKKAQEEINKLKKKTREENNNGQA